MTALYFDRRTFFDAVRGPLFGGSLSQAAVDSMDAMLSAYEAAPLSADLRFAAYPFATTIHEVGRDMTATTENLNYTSASRIRQVWPTRFPTDASAQPFVRNPQGLANNVYASRMGNGPSSSGDGWRFRGRGKVQLTGRENYQRATTKLRDMGLDVDFVAQPEAMLDPAFSSIVLFQGMAEGWFTGRRLAQYFSATVDDPVEARRIINADVSANGAAIAAQHRSFLAALNAAAAVAPSPEPEPAPEPEPLPEPEPELVVSFTVTVRGRGPFVVEVDPLPPYPTGG